MSSPHLALPTFLAPTDGATTTDRPRRPSRRRASGARRAPATDPRPGPTPADDALSRAVAAALPRLVRLDRTDGRSSHTERRRIEALLRDAIARHRALGPAPMAVPAVTVACAHLAAGGVDDAYSALLSAQDLL